MGKISIGEKVIYDDSVSSGGGFSFKSSTKEIEIASGTTITLAMPSDISQGDLLVIVAYNRSTLAPPQGWIMGATYGPWGDFNQRNWIFYKTADGSEAGQNITLVSGASGRFAASILCFDNPTGFEVALTTSSHSATRAEIPSVESGEDLLIVLTCSNSLSATSGSVSMFIDSNNLVNLHKPTVDIPRFVYGFSNYRGVLSGYLSASVTNVADSAITIIGFRCV